MDRQCNIGNESKRAKTTILAYYISTTFSDRSKQSRTAENSGVENHKHIRS
jgi:hypothetical protein